MAYKRTNKGRDFLLYSIGSDQIDDGGKHTDNWRETGDLVYWPAPAGNRD